jgi:Xaa-Pro aminopeptidase
MKKIASKRVKTASQIKAIRDVQYAAEKAMQAVIHYLKSTHKPTSEQAHALIDSVLKKYNCESPEGHIVASGKQSFEPHETGSGYIKKGVPIVIDIYPRSKTTGYYADMSRTVCIGKPSLKLQKMYDAVLEAQQLALSMLRPKVKCADIQNAVDKLFIKRGFKTSGKGKVFTFRQGFVHSLGHGVGLRIHEAPTIGSKSLNILKAGDVVTIEPGLYYSDIGGVRLEDVIILSKDGIENMTHFPKQLRI